MMKLFFTVIKGYWLLLTFVILIAIGVLSLTPLEQLPEVPGSDKTHHFIAYAALAFPVAFARPKQWLFFIFGFLAYSGLIELLQPYVNRYGELLDMVANSAGLVIGVTVAYLINRFHFKE